MRIREIISESVANEALGSELLKRAGQWALGGGAKTSALARLATKLADEMLTAVRPSTVKPMTRMQAAKALSAEERKFALDPKFISNINKRAASIVAKTKRDRLLGEIQKLTNLSWVNKLLTAGIVLTPLTEYINNTNQYQEQLEAGEIDEATYEQHRREEVTKLIGTYAAQFASLYAAKKVSKVLSIFTMFTPKLTPIVNNLSQTAAKGLTVWLGTDDGQQWMAKTFLSALPAGIVEDLVTFIGGTTDTFIDYLKSKIPGFENLGPSTSGATKQPSLQTSPGASQTSGKPVAPTTNAADVGKFAGSAIKVAPQTSDNPFNVDISTD